MAAFTRQRLSLRAGLVLLALVVLVMLPLAGCYDLDEQVIPAPQGDINPYRYNDATMDNGGHMYLSSAGYYNDYRFRQVAKDGTTTTGTFRMMHIYGDVYAVQSVDDSDKSISLLFYHITSNHFAPTDYADANAAQNLASQYSVKLDVADEDMSGAASNILAFLRASSSLQFK